MFLLPGCRSRGRLLESCCLQVMQRRSKPRQFTFARPSSSSSAKKNNKFTVPTLMSVFLLNATHGNAFTAPLKMYTMVVGESARLSIAIVMLPFAGLYTVYALAKEKAFWPGCGAFSLGMVATIFQLNAKLGQGKSRQLAVACANLLFGTCMLGAGATTVCKAKDEYVSLPPRAPLVMTFSENPLPPSFSEFCSAVTKSATRFKKQLKEQTESLALEDLLGYLAVGAVTGVGLVLMGPTGVALPYPLLTNFVGLDSNHAAATIIVGWIPSLCLTCVIGGLKGIKPKPHTFLAFVMVVGSCYYISERFVFNKVPAFLLDGVFGVVAVGIGSNIFRNSVKGISTVLRT